MIDLKGHTLNKIAFNESDQTLSLTLDESKIFLIKVEGDCCSSGKFIGTSSEYDLHLPSKIVEEESERNEMFENIGSGLYQVYEKVYVLENGNKFKIVYDNESNGYYGSNLASYYDDEEVYGWKSIKQEGGEGKI